MTAEIRPTPRGNGIRRAPRTAAPGGPTAGASSAVARSRAARRPVAPGRLALDPAPPSIGPRILERAARVIRVLGHPLRLRLLERLETGEVNVTDLVSASGATQALVSQHLGILRAEGVVGTRRDGGRVFYRITEPKVHRILDCIRDCDMPEVRTWGSARDLLDPTGDD
jgi:DNA-binding transcriptional ArsR family regulator